MIIPKEKILKAKEKLGGRNSEIIAEVLRLGERGYTGSPKDKIHCPFHDDDAPSFIYNPKNYTYHCFGCQKTVDVLDAFTSSGLSFAAAAEKLFKLAEVKHSFNELGVKTRRSYRYPKETPISSKEAVYAYLEKRKISKTTADYADVREDSEKNCVFNYYDTNNVLTLVKRRPSRRVDKSEAKTWCQPGADSSPLLFNMNRVNTTSPLLITEGEIDCLSAIEAGYQNAVSVPFGAGNFSWIDENWEWLEQFDEIIICADNDAAGIKMQKEAVYRLGAWRAKVVDIPPAVTLKNGAVKETKDLNLVLFYSGKQAVLDLILNAKETPLESAADFSDVRNVDLSDIDGVTTGFSELDEELMKLFYGTLNIVTGINGSGKSSFLSQLVCVSADENKNVWLYSGELPNSQCKNWIIYIFAGQRHLKEFKTENHVYYKISFEARKKIDDFYRGRIYLYKDDRDHKTSSLLKSMEDAVRRRGVKLLILDNLTSINLDAPKGEKYDKQAEFVAQLINFAKKYNVVVMLVVHPHKIESVRRLEKTDIQGISAIIDLAHRIISLYRVRESDRKGERMVNGRVYKFPPLKCDVVCDVLKDRLLGREGVSKQLFYDKPSRRFFSGYEDLDRRYGWDDSDYSPPLPYPPPQLRLGDDDEAEVLGQQNIQKEVF